MSWAGESCSFSALQKQDCRGRGVGKAVTSRQQLIDSAVTCLYATALQYDSCVFLASNKRWESEDLLGTAASEADSSATPLPPCSVLSPLQKADSLYLPERLLHISLWNTLPPECGDHHCTGAALKEDWRNPQRTGLTTALRWLCAISFFGSIMSLISSRGAMKEDLCTTGLNVQSFHWTQWDTLLNQPLSGVRIVGREANPFLLVSYRADHRSPAWADSLGLPRERLGSG